MTKKEVHPALHDEITRAFKLAKETVSFLYSRLELADVPAATGMAYLLRDLVEQENAALKWIARE